MTVINKHRIIKESWTFGVCENCRQNSGLRQNSENVEMVKERLVSGDSGGQFKSEKKMWVCPRCGYNRRL